MAWFAGNSVWQLVKQSDVVTLFVLGVLFAMSVLCWTVFICLAIVMRIKQRQIKKALKEYAKLQSLEEMVSFSSTWSGTAPGYLISHNLFFLKALLQKPELSDKGYVAGLIEDHVEQTVESLICHQETYLPILSTCAAVAPLLGLFGTVWGLIHSFIRISEKQMADITVVAPGIAEALLTTLAGLLVAIPAFLMYNYLMAKLRKVEHSLLVLADKMTFAMKCFVLQ